MKRSSAVLAVVAGLVLTHSGLLAQPPGEIDLKITTPILGLPPIVLAVPSTAATPAPAATPDGGCPQPCKICVSEVKHTTRKVYAGKCEDYCLPYCSCLSLLRGGCDCETGPCGDLRVRHRLVVKKVPGCDTKQCVPREVPVQDSKDAPSGGAGSPVPSVKQPAMPKPK